MNRRRESRAFLQIVGNSPEHELDIAGAALHLAALTRSKVDLEPAELHLDALTRDVAARVQNEAPVSAEAAAGVLAGVVAGENRYRGDDQTYDDLQNADLLSVIERRKGLPVALGILYIHVARAQGWRAFGLNFPGHFLIALEFEGSRAILDPFHEGVCRTPPELRELLKMVAFHFVLGDAHDEDVSIDCIDRVVNRFYIAVYRQFEDEFGRDPSITCIVNQAAAIFNFDLVDDFADPVDLPCNSNRIDPMFRFSDAPCQQHAPFVDLARQADK